MTQLALWAKSVILSCLDMSLQWLYNEHHGVPNHRHLHCLLSRLFRLASKKTSKLRVTGLFRGIHLWPVDSPHKGPVMRKMFPLDGGIMFCYIFCCKLLTLTIFLVKGHHLKYPPGVYWNFVFKWFQPYYCQIFTRNNVDLLVLSYVFPAFIKHLTNYFFVSSFILWFERPVLAVLTLCCQVIKTFMMTSSNGNIFLFTKASDAELWHFL